MNAADNDLTEKKIKHIKKKLDLPQAVTHYLPPSVKEGSVVGVVLVSEGEVVEKVEEEPVMVEPETRCEESEAHVTCAEGEESDAGKKEQILVERVVSLAVDEVDSNMQRGSANSRNEETISSETIVAKEPRTNIAQMTKDDPILATVISLDDALSEGYHWREGLLFRRRLDVLGENVEQLCLPKEYRDRCLKLAHEQFGRIECVTILGNISTGYHCHPM